LTGCNIQEWGSVKKDEPCFSVSGGRLNVNGCTFNKSGLVAVVGGRQTRAIFNANMGVGDMTVRNSIGSSLVLGGNNPEWKPAKD
ncbi:MAG: hypothetical protein WCL39_10875, partial [Armatimonadota bacterium]